MITPPAQPLEKQKIRQLLSTPARVLLPVLRILARKERAEVFDAVEFLLFCCVGAANTLLDFIVFLAASSVFPLYASRIASWAAACTFSYFVNKRWVFRAKSGGAGTAVRFIIVNLFGLALGIIMIEVLHGNMGWGRIPSYLASLPVTIFANYFGYKLWSFKKR